MSSEKTNEELVELIQAGTNVKENLGLLYKQNIGFIRKVIRPYFNLNDEDDLMQEAYLGLVKAAERYDNQQEVMFISYASFWVKQSIRRYLANHGRTKRIPVHQLQLISKYQKFKIDYITEHGETPTEEDFAKHLEITIKQLRRLERLIHESQCESLEGTIPGTDDFTYADVLADDCNIEDEVIGEMNQAKQNEVIWECVNQLPERQQQVIKCRFKGKQILSEVASTLNVTRERVRQIELQALRRLKKYEQLQEIAAEWGYYKQDAYRYGVQRFKDTQTSATEYIALRRLEIEQRLREIDGIVNL